MKRALIAAALCVGLFATTASTCTQPVIEGGKHCGKVAGSNAVNDLLPKVNEVLGCSISDTSAIPACVGSGLADLGVQFGIDFVLCALEQIEGRKFVSPGDPNVGVKQRRAKAYLEERKEQSLLIDGPPAPAHARLRADGGSAPWRCGPGYHNLAPYEPGRVCITDDYSDAAAHAFVKETGLGPPPFFRRWPADEAPPPTTSPAQRPKSHDGGPVAGICVGCGVTSG